MTTHGTIRLLPFLLSIIPLISIFWYISSQKRLNNILPKDQMLFNVNPPLGNNQGHTKAAIGAILLNGHGNQYNRHAYTFTHTHTPRLNDNDV